MNYYSLLAEPEPVVLNVAMVTAAAVTVAESLGMKAAIGRIFAAS